MLGILLQVIQSSQVGEGPIMKRRISLFDPFYKNVTVYVGLGLKVYGWFVVINLVNLEITVRLFTIQSFTLLKPEYHVILLLKKSLGFLSVPVVCRQEQIKARI